MQHGHRHEDLVAALDAERAPVTPVSVAFTPRQAPVRNVIAVCRFSGEPGREQEAAEAWAFDLTYFFLRGVGEAPAVEYQNGIYTVRGLMTTTHLGDRAPVTSFNHGGLASLDFILAPARVESLREMYPRTAAYRFDGRGQEGQ